MAAKIQAKIIFSYVYLPKAPKGDAEKENLWVGMMHRANKALYHTVFTATPDKQVTERDVVQSGEPTPALPISQACLLEAPVQVATKKA